MSLGNPRFGYDDIVKFSVKDEDGDLRELEGDIAVVDAYGIFGDNTQVYYDIMVKPDPVYGEDGCLYKHIPESKVDLA